MLAWPLRLAVGTVEEGCCRRCRALERPIVADIDPGPAGLGASVARCQHRHWSIVTVNLLRREDVPPDRFDQWLQEPGRLADPVG